MEVQINQQTTSISDNVSLQQVLDLKGLGTAKGIAIAVNEAVVPGDRWDTHILQPEDRIMIIHATQGG